MARPAPVRSPDHDRPAAPRHVVDRARVTKALDQCAVAPVVLVHACAGAGKTTAVARWVRDRARPVAWKTLGPEHNDVATLTRDVLSAPALAVPDANAVIVFDDFECITAAAALAAVDDAIL
jgi:LuxR family maltose regulon positive regulatory protein